MFSFAFFFVSFISFYFPVPIPQPELATNFFCPGILAGGLIFNSISLLLVTHSFGPSYLKVKKKFSCYGAGGQVVKRKEGAKLSMCQYVLIMKKSLQLCDCIPRMRGRGFFCWNSCGSKVDVLILDDLLVPHSPYFHSPPTFQLFPCPVPAPFIYIYSLYPFCRLTSPEASSPLIFRFFSFLARTVIRSLFYSHPFCIFYTTNTHTLTNQ